MKKALSLALASVLMSAGCSLVSPYTLTFTNTPGSVVEPSSTLDLVVSAPTLAYVSRVECEGGATVELLPIVADKTAVSTLHKLSLDALKGMPAGALCEVTVTVFDPTTTETASDSIEVTMFGSAAEETEAPALETEQTPEETVPTEEAVEVETSVETNVESSLETPSETHDSNPSESTDAAGTDEQGA